ncbi:MAG: 5'/3'-nucleotidase SurE [Spirochaetia bacterium]|nr:5'/3'-nucleotidase SurE [Spirochaetota bacterium]MCX8096328.1 5'/3'-nucleotidase SurE [Spirochaetota bacterium]MDW8112311.1 5'/3'-nucleotidase SurE [Spirochaetia bacterium]
MNILLVNDDGIQSPILKMLYEELSKKHKVFVVVPDGNRSGASHSITVFRSINLKRIDENIYSIDAMPADCVKIAFLSLVKEKIDLTVSGINLGPNLGLDIYYSGTFSAARESAMLGVRAISSSINVGWYEIDNDLFKQAALFISKLVDFYPIEQIPVDVFPNINIPKAKFSDIKGVRPAKPYERYYFETSYIKEEITSDDEEKCNYILDGGVREHLDISDSDIYLNKNNYITYTMYSYYPFKQLENYEILVYESFRKALDYTKSYFSTKP